jgi:hypothetical protein
MPKTVNLRNLPDDLVRRAKSCAALRGQTLKDFVLVALEKATELDVPNPAPMAMAMMRTESRRRTKRK